MENQVSCVTKNNVCFIQGHDAMKCKARGGYFRVGVRGAKSIF